MPGVDVGDGLGFMRSEGSDEVGFVHGVLCMVYVILMRLWIQIVDYVNFAKLNAVDREGNRQGLKRPRVRVAYPLVFGEFRIPIHAQRPQRPQRGPDVDGATTDRSFIEILRLSPTQALALPSVHHPLPHRRANFLASSLPHNTFCTIGY